MLNFISTTIFTFLTVLGWSQSPEFTSSPVVNGVYNEFYKYEIKTAIDDDDDDDDDIDVEILLNSGTLPQGLVLTDFGNGEAELAGIAGQTGSFPLELVVQEISDPDNNDTQNFTLVIAKAAADVTINGLTAIYDGSPKPVTVTTDPTGLAVDVTYDGSTDPPIEVGSYSVVATVTDPNYTGSANGTLTISSSTATVTLGTLNFTYDGAPKPVTATTDPAGLAVEITYDGSTEAPVNAGSYDVVATITEPGYSGTTTGTLVINKAVATVTLGALNQTFDGSPKPVSVTTNPAGLSVSITYDGAATAPSGIGTYAVVATVTDPNYTGSANGTLTISSSTATVTLGTLNFTYDGAPKPVTATTDPAGLAVEITYDGSTEAPVNAGSYDVVATITEPGYSGTTTGTLVINKAVATVTLGALNQTFDGSPKPVSVTTNPAGLSVSITYDGAATVPSGIGTYAVVATVTDPNYTGSANGTLTISSSTATVTLGTLNFTYDGAPKPVTATTNPAGLAVEITYDGSTEAPVNAGSYDVVATITEPGYSGTTTGTLVINKAVATVTLGALNQTFDGSPKPVSVTTNPAGLSVSITYDGAATAPSGIGTYAVVATVTDPNYTGSANGTLTISSSTATVTLGTLNFTYDGAPKLVTATTNPAGLAVEITYDGSTEAPVNAGSYDVVATITEPGYSGTATGTLVINKAMATVTLGALNQTFDGSPKPVTVNTVPAGLNVDVTYDGSASPPVNIGSYVVVATVNDPNYAGVANGTLVVSKDEATVSLSNLTQNYDGSPKSVTVTTIPHGLATDVTYNGSANAPIAPGSYTVEAVITEPNYTGSASEILIINGAPTSTGLPDVNVNEDAANLSINLKQFFNDVEDTDEELNFSIQSNTNTALFTEVIITATQFLILDFAPDQNGAAEITVRATDTDGLFLDDQFTVTVAPVQDAPVFTTTPATGVLQGATYAYEPIAIDPDEGDILSYTSVTLPVWLSFTDYGDGTGLLTGVAAVSDIGFHNITLVVSDNHGNSKAQIFQIEVIQSNGDPIFTSQPVISATEGQLYSYNITAQDTDNTTLTITAPTLPGWLSLTDHGEGNATLEGTPADADAKTGNHAVSLKVEDPSGAVAVQSFTITLEDVNNNPEFVSTPGDEKVGLGAEINFEIVVDDADNGDVLTVAILSGADWLSITNSNNRTATLTGTVPTTAAGEKVEVKLVVTDQIGASSGTQSFVLTINIPPIVGNISKVIDEDEVLVLNSDALNPGYTDPDGDEITKVKIITLSDFGRLTVNGGEVAVGQEIDLDNASFTYTPPKDDAGYTHFEWIAFDGYNWSGQNAAYNIEIVPVNDAPVLTNIETSPITYSQGDEAIAITESIIINDVDNIYMEGATVIIAEGYSGGNDVLSYDNLLNDNIAGTFDATNGTLTLTGTDTRSEYEAALSDVKYQNQFLGETDLKEKKLSIAVTDGADTSNVVFRRIIISEILPELELVNAFTPNGDSVNDQWDFVDLESYSVIDIRIYTESGTEIFSCFKADCQWDGTYNGQNLPAGAYFYTIDLNNGKRKYQGIVSILK